jgi:hypothetical protein
MNSSTITGLTLLALSVLGDRRKFRFDREIPVEKTTQRGDRSRASSRDPERGKRQAPHHKTAFVLEPGPEKFHAHEHIFTIGGMEIRTSQPFLHGENKSKHAHLVSVPTVVRAKGMNRRLKINMSTTFDDFGHSHTHKLLTHGRVFISGRPVR